MITSLLPSFLRSNPFLSTTRLNGAKEFRKSLILFSLLVLSCGPVNAKPRSGVSSTDFDGKPSGARFIGLGETGAAAGGMPESPIWNPATLYDMKGTAMSIDLDVARQSRLGDEVLLQDVSLRGRKLTYLGFAGPEGAFFYRPLAHFNERTVTDPADPANNFTDTALSINQFGLSASQPADDNWTHGLNLSYLNARRGFAEAASGRPPVLELADGNGFTFDYGVRYREDTLSLGVAFFNVPGLVYWNRYKTDQLPVILRTGLGFYPVPVFGFVGDYEKRYYRGGVPRPDFLHMGMELTALPWLQLRGGTYGEDLSDAEKTVYTAGFSAASSKRQQLDFALRTYRVAKERVYNYFVSILWPLPGKLADGGKDYAKGKTFYQAANFVTPE